MMKQVTGGLLLSSILLGACQPVAKKAAVISAKPETEERPDSLCYQTYGLPEPYYDKALHTVLARYGVQVKSVAGCVVTDSLTTGVAENNKALFAALDKKLGAGAEARINAEVEGRAKTQQRIEDLLRKNSEVHSREKALAAAHGSLSFASYEENAGGGLDIAADELHYVNGEWKRSAWKSFSVDTGANAVTVKR